MNASRKAAAAVFATALALGGCQKDEESALSVVVSLPQQGVANVAKATLTVDYSGSGASILSEGGVPACAFILPGVRGDFSDDGAGTLTVHTAGPRALRGPADIAVCRMEASDPDATADDIARKLAVQATAAEDSTGKLIDVTAKAPKRQAPERGEAAVEAAQAEAVKAAEAISSAAPPPGTNGSTSAGATGTAGSVQGGLKAGPGGKLAGAATGVPATGWNTPAAGGATGRAQPPPPRATGSSPFMANSQMAGRPGADGDPGANPDTGVPSNQDRDPSYDDSLSDDERAPAYNVELAVSSDSGRVGALQIEVTHLGRAGGFIGRGDQLDCTPLVNAIVAGNYEGERVARLGLINLQGIPTPAQLMRCGFRTRESLGPASFLVEVSDASDTNSDVIQPMPTVVVSSVTRR